MTEYPIWNPDTGITDIETDPSELGVSYIPGIKAVWADQRERLKGSAQLSDFTERLSREWAIETGVIENLYAIERGVTQTLIERGFQAELLSHGSTNKPREYVLQLLHDQKYALEGVFDFVKGERPLSASYIKELHAALLRSQDTTEVLDAQGHHVEVPLVKGTWKMQANYPVRDGVTYTYCPPEHVGAEMERLIDMHAAHMAAAVPSEVQAAWLHHRFTQIHPFQDGNGRVARAIASLVLVKDGLFPLVVTRDEKSAYLDALEAADRGNLEPLVTLIARLQLSQFQKASAISESSIEEKGVKAALDDLDRAAERIADDKRAELKKVFDLARIIEDEIKDGLEAIKPNLEVALGRISDEVTVFVTKSSADTDHYFRAQIIENARDHIKYFANTREYRSWVSLNMHWSRRAQLVFTIHDMGRSFNGSLICAPFLEFKDMDEDDQTRATFAPTIDEGFVFFYNEDSKELRSRFHYWWEKIIALAVTKISQNL